jgi:hypothetical protein
VDIEGIFDPVLKNIEELVLKQMDQLAPLGLSSKASYSVLRAEGTYCLSQALILAGGLGSSKYLFRELDKRFPNLNLIQPPDAQACYSLGLKMAYSD